MSIVVVVGGGQAAAQTVTSLRQEGFIGRIVLVSDEPVAPYQRPPLSKGFLVGEVPPERLQVRDRNFYQQAEIELRTGVTVQELRLADRTVQMDDGETLAFDHLVLATGSRPRPLHVAGSDHPRMVYLRTLADAQALRALCAASARLVLIGGGYIGLEVAAAARKLGLRVTVLEAAPRLLPRVAGPVVAAFYDELHRAHGVDIRCNQTVARIEGPTVRPCVITDRGERFEADVVIAAIGAVPNMELAERAGLVCNHGIVVDEFCCTSVPGIYAAGDCTEQPSGRHGSQVRLESVPNAIEQGRTVAATICGKHRPHRQVPWFWSDQYDVKLQTAGLQRGHDRQVVRGDPASRSFAVFYLRGERLVAVDAVNRPAEFSLAKAWIAGDQAIAQERLADDSVPPRQIAA